MISEKAIISRISQNKIFVKIINDNEEGCEHCRNKSLCGINEKEFGIPYEKGFSEGETVTLNIESISLLQASFIIYGIPGLFLLGGVILGYFVLFANFAESTRALYSFFCSLVTLTLSAILIKIIDKIKGNKLVFKIKKFYSE